MCAVLVKSTGFVVVVVVLVVCLFVAGFFFQIQDQTSALLYSSTNNMSTTANIPTTSDNLTTLMNDGYRVTCGIEVQNLTRFSLVHPQASMYSGVLSLPPKPIWPGSREPMVSQCMVTLFTYVFVRNKFAYRDGASKNNINNLSTKQLQHHSINQTKQNEKTNKQTSKTKHVGLFTVLSNIGTTCVSLFKTRGGTGILVLRKHTQKLTGLFVQYRVFFQCHMVDINWCSRWLYKPVKSLAITILP